jgi:hypothetical protein
MSYSLRPKHPRIFTPLRTEAESGPTDGSIPSEAAQTDEPVRPPTPVETGIGGTRFFDLSTASAGSADQGEPKCGIGPRAVPRLAKPPLAPRGLPLEEAVAFGGELGNQTVTEYFTERVDVTPFSPFHLGC